MSSTDKFENLEFGNVDIPEDALSGKSVKVRITMMVDADILEAFKLRAAQEHTKYQTLMNRTLREGLETRSGSTLESRLAALEQCVRRQKAKVRLKNHSARQGKRGGRKTRSTG
ncbi:MAG: BrnA antitoxin family protein [Aestuariivirgaceae bacterium]